MDVLKPQTSALETHDKAHIRKPNCTVKIQSNSNKYMLWNIEPVLESLAVIAHHAKTAKTILRGEAIVHTSSD